MHEVAVVSALGDSQQLTLQPVTPPIVITGLDPVICNSTVPREITGSSPVMTRRDAPTELVIVGRQLSSQSYEFIYFRF